MSLSLLLIDADTPFASALAVDMRTIGHRATTVPDGQAALRALDSDQFDAVLLDPILPGLDGLTMLRRVRSGGMTLPVIILTALARPVEKVEGLNAGADDYLVKPVSPAELDARLRAILRGRQWTAASADTIRAGDILVSPTKFRAWRAGRPIDLQNLELNLLAELARNADAVLSRAILVERVWGYDVAPDSNIVDVYIRRLRLKLTAEGGRNPIVTIRGVGYMLRGESGADHSTTVSPSANARAFAT